MKKIIRAFSIASCIIISTLLCDFATAKTYNVTVWKYVDASLSDLLNDGWKLINFSATDVVNPPSPGITGSRSQGFVYVLFKNGKYVTCIIPNPNLSSENFSACRLIN